MTGRGIVAVEQFQTPEVVSASQQCLIPFATLRETPSSLKQLTARMALSQSSVHLGFADTALPKTGVNTAVVLVTPWLVVLPVEVGESGEDRRHSIDSCGSLPPESLALNYALAMT